MKVNFKETVFEGENQVWSQLVEDLSKEKGCLFASEYSYPGRYHSWQIGLKDPVLRLTGWGRYFEIEILDAACVGVLVEIYKHLEQVHFLETLEKGLSLNQKSPVLVGKVKSPSDADSMDESQRTHQNSIFTLIRSLLTQFETACPKFGLYGSFGYKLVHQFEHLTKGVHGMDCGPDLLLYLPRYLLVKENAYAQSKVIDYEFLELPSQDPDFFKAVIETKSPEKGLSPQREGPSADHFQQLVESLKPLFQRGELFEAVPSYERIHGTKGSASRLYKDLRKMNPSPFHYLINMGTEQLLGASPEMYVRVNDRLVETCPISGTIPRGRDSLSDHQQIRTLLNSKKDEDELTMCTDVDRNDKSKVCDPATIKVIGRRQIELYSHLIHTVDHVSGTLRPDRDGIDAFIAHMWAVTVTGAPKKAAMNWIEENETSPRQWYGGAVGYFTVKGDINTGLTLRGIQLKEGQASVRVGATILYDSDPKSEAIETLTKAAAMEKVIEQIDYAKLETVHDEGVSAKGPLPLEVLVIDHDDSFVHTLAGYFEKYGCRVKTVRQSNIEKHFKTLEKAYPDLIVLSPGPGTPEDFKLHDSIRWAVERNIPLFGVCLGLQGIITYFGGKLGQLELPMHGKTSQLMSSGTHSQKTKEKQLFHLEALDQSPKIGRYHSLYALEIPDVIDCYAVTEDQCPMAICHKELPIWALQFHPESIMSAEDEFGGQIIKRLIQKIRS